jgi:hypothetical protein
MSTLFQERPTRFPDEPLLVAILLVWCSTARALLPSGPSPSLKNHTVEALTAISPLIVIGNVQSYPMKRNTYAPQEVEIKVDEVLKAPPDFDPSILLSGNFVWRDEPFNGWPAAGTKVVLFLWYQHYRSWLINDFVVLDGVGTGRSGASPIMRSLTLSPLKDGQEVVKIVQQEALRNPATTAVESYANFTLEGMKLPADNRLLPSAREWVHSNDPEPRLLGAEVMRAHPEAQDTALLKSLLEDTYTMDVPCDLSPWSGHEYVVRQAAMRALTARGEAFVMPVLSTPRDDLYHPVPLIWTTLWLLAPPGVYAGTWWFRRRRQRRPRPPLGKILVSGLTSFCLWWALLAGWEWCRSYATIDDYVYAANGACVDVTSIRGLLFMTVRRPWPVSTELVHLRFGTAAINYTRSYEEYAWNSALGPWEWRDFEHAHCPLLESEFNVGAYRWNNPRSYVEPFNLRSATPRTCASAGLVTTYLSLVLALLAFPVLRVLVQGVVWLWRGQRERRRDKRGLCRKCLYDLRAHRKGQRCPECGEVIGNPPPVK